MVEDAERVSYRVVILVDELDFVVPAFYVSARGPKVQAIVVLWQVFFPLFYTIEKTSGVFEDERVVMLFLALVHVRHCRDQRCVYLVNACGVIINLVVTQCFERVGEYVHEYPQQNRREENR